MDINIEIGIPFTEAPQWLGKAIFSRKGDVIVVEAMRDSGTLLGELHIPIGQWQTMTAILIPESE